MKSQKQWVDSRILLLWQNVLVVRHQQQCTVFLSNCIFRKHHWDIHKDLDRRYTKSNWFRSWNQLTIQCVFASLSNNHFDLNEYVNKQNGRIWGTENPKPYIEKPTHLKRVSVWCGFRCRGIIGTFFFENEQEVTVTVNGYRYREYSSTQSIMCLKIGPLV